MGDGRVRAPTKHVRLQQLNGLGFLSAERETIADVDNASCVVPQRRFSEHLFEDSKPTITERLVIDRVDEAGYVCTWSSICLWAPVIDTPQPRVSCKILIAHMYEGKGNRPTSLLSRTEGATGRTRRRQLVRLRGGETSSLAPLIFVACYPRGYFNAPSYPRTYIYIRIVARRHP